jgi:hypothetical protein
MRLTKGKRIIRMIINPLSANKIIHIRIRHLRPPANQM